MGAREGRGGYARRVLIREGTVETKYVTGHPLSAVL